MPIRKKSDTESNQKNNSNNKLTSLNPSKPKYSFEDIILNERIKNEILDILSIKSHQNKVFDEWGLAKTHKRGKKVALNLYGPPGTGKTMSAHAIADFLKKDILEVNYADIESKFVGETPKNLKKAFEIATHTDSVLFFDEADAILSKRVENMSNSTDTSVNQTRSVFLMLLNDFTGTIIFATNFISNYDSAFMRRILGHIHFELPDIEERLKIWEHLIPNSFPTDVNKKNMAEKYPKISGSDISNAILKTAFRTAREKKSISPHIYFEEAIESIIESKNKNTESTK